jgi:NAD(P)-dependent dehydrogenase (short-subunit alcohol dehydrogenase family)
MALAADPLWLITGCSTGLGHALARTVLVRGHRLLAAARDPSALGSLVALGGERVRIARLDVADPKDIANTIDAAREWGGVDILVNNAGYGYMAALEEGEDAKIRRLFDVNVFGAAAVMRAVLPSMRAKAAGAIVNIGSMVGISGGPGSAYYAASKFALEGLTDSLAGEVGKLGIDVMIVEPGPVRTDFAGRSIVVSPELPAYAQTAGLRRRSVLQASGTQRGDPNRIAELIVAAVERPVPPRRLVIGELAMDVVARKLDDLRAAIDSERAGSLATDFED